MTIALEPKAATNRVAQVRHLLQDLEAAPERVRGGIEGLDDDELRSFGLDSFVLNLLSLFGESWGAERVQRVASRCAREKLWRGWEFYSALSHAGAATAEPVGRIAGFDSEPLRSLLQAGGMVLCTHHVGDYRFVPFDLAVRRIRHVTPMDNDAWRQSRAALDTAGPRISDFAGLVDIERPSGGLALARALRRGQPVFVYADGNTGLDGPTGGTSRTTIRLQGHPVAVKNGYARLAAAMGVPLLPILVPRRPDGPARVVVGEPVAPGGRLQGKAQEGFVAAAVQAVYALLEEHLEELADQWETVCFVHRWRSLAAEAPPPPPPAPDAGRFEDVLAGSGRLHLDRRRIARIGGRSEALWVDTSSLRGLRPPAELAGLMEELARPAGVDVRLLRERLSSASDDEREARFLALLWSQRALIVKLPAGRNGPAGGEDAA
jgi:hypothetical protein